MGSNGEDKGPSGIDKVPSVEHKFERAAPRCVLGSECVWMALIPRGHTTTTFTTVQPEYNKPSIGHEVGALNDLLYLYTPSL